MRRRCNNPRCRNYRYYGGRGIRVCDRWEQSFLAFLEDMGQRPSAKHSIERVDNDGNYEPSNCRWIDRSLQQRNTRQMRMLTYRGQTKSLVEWSEELSVDLDLIRGRLRDGWSAERILETPKIPRVENFKGSQA